MGAQSRLVANVLAALSLTAGLLIPGSAAADGIDATCVLPLTKFDPVTMNIAYYDESAIYWVGAYQAVPGMRLRIDGRFPHARYMSFHVYDQAQRPLDAIADLEIAPEPGSDNPFVRGAKRDGEQRSYTAFIDFGPRPEIPEDRAPNTVYTGTGQNGLPNVNGTFFYRVYLPHNGLDETGGIGLPTVTLQTSDGGPAPRSLCSDMSKPVAPSQLHEEFAESNVDLPLGAGRRATDPVTWRKFTNVLYGLTQSDTLSEFGGSGGVFSNLHNAYLAASVSRDFGQVLVIRFRAPTFPDTRSGAKKMRAAQLRYFSMCQNEMFSQRFIACRPDDQSVVGSDGFVTYVMSTPEQRPAAATTECGVTWLPWGPSHYGTLIYRNMLPASDFAESIQASQVDHEAGTMGEYFPTSQYYADAAAYDREVGCA